MYLLYARSIERLSSVFVRAAVARCCTQILLLQLGIGFISLHGQHPYPVSLL
jgi:hypothetical protein